MSPVNIDELYNQKVGHWKEVYGLDFSEFISPSHNFYFKKSIWENEMKPENVITEKPLKFKEFDFWETQVEDFERIYFDFYFKTNNKLPSTLHGFTVWFDLGFTLPSSQSIVLPTSPFDPVVKKKKNYSFFFFFFFV